MSITISKSTQIRTYWLRCLTLNRSNSFLNFQGSLFFINNSIIVLINTSKWLENAVGISIIFGVDNGKSGICQINISIGIVGPIIIVEIKNVVFHLFWFLTIRNDAGRRCRTWNCAVGCDCTIRRSAIGCSLTIRLTINWLIRL